MDKPGSSYNVDESGVPLYPKSPHVLALKGQRKERYRSTGNEGQVTAVGCVSATGQAMPPFVVFDAKSLNMVWTKVKFLARHTDSVAMVGWTRSCSKCGFLIISWNM